MPSLTILKMSRARELFIKQNNWKYRNPNTKSNMVTAKKHPIEIVKCTVFTLLEAIRFAEDRHCWRETV